MKLNKKFSKLLCSVLAIAMMATMLPAMALVASAADEIIIMPGVDGYTEVSGNWANSGMKYEGASTGRYASSQDAALSYVPTIPAAGNYKVEMYIVPTHAEFKSPGNVDVIVKYDGGEETKKLDFYKQSGWVELGTYKFAAGTSGSVDAKFVSVGDGGTNMRAGAVRFTPTSGSSKPATSKPAQPSQNVVAQNLAFTDISDSPYQDEISLLSSVSVLAGDPAGTFRPKDGISRAEMAAIIVRISGLEASVIAQAGKTKFDDVKEDHWATGYINIASGLGVINGDGNGIFRPDDKVSYNEAVKMLVCVLGFGMKADECGGWPSGYLVVANDLRISEDVIEKSGEASRETIAKLTANAIDIDYLEKTGYGSEENYTQVEGRTLLSEKLKIQKIENIVTETQKASFAGQGSLKEDQVRIGNTVYLTGGTDIGDYVGYPVIAYAKYDAKVSTLYSTIVNFKVDDKHLDVITIEAEDIVAAASNYIEIYEDEEVSTKRIRYTTANPYVFVNGIGDLSFDLASLNPTNVGGNFQPSFDGKVIIIDKDQDETIDTLFVEKSETLVISRVVKANNGFYVLDQHGRRIPATGKIDINDKNVVIDVTKDGQKASYTDMLENNIVSYTRAGNTHTFNVSSETVSGTVDMITSDGEIVIDGQSYKKSTNVPSMLACAPGDAATLYLDVYGKVAYVSKTSAGADDYAFMTNIGSETIMGNTKYTIYLIDSDNTLNKLKLASKVSFIKNGVQNAGNNGNPYSSDSLTMNDLASYGLVTLPSTPVPQLVKFSKNSSDEVTSIELAIDLSAKVPNKYTDSEQETFRKSNILKTGAVALSTFYAANNGVLSQNSEGSEGLFKWKGATMLFVPIENGAVLHDDVGFGKADSFFTNPYHSYQASAFTVYDSDKSGVPAVIVAQIDTSGNQSYRDRGSKYMLVSRVATVMEEGETKYEITGYTSDHQTAGGLESIVLSNSVAHSGVGAVADKQISQIKPGDIINFFAMPNGKVYHVRIFYNSASVDPIYAGSMNQASQTYSMIDFTHGGHLPIAGVALGYMKDYVVDGSDESIVFHIPAGTPGLNGNAAANGTTSHEILMTGIKSFFKYDVAKGTLVEMDSVDIPLPEELDPNTIDINNLPAYVHTTVDDSGVTHYWKWPKILFKIGRQDTALSILNMVYIDEGIFE